MNIIEWWSKHPEVIAVGQNNIDKKASALATKDFDPHPLPDEWKNMNFEIKLEQANGIIQQKDPIPVFEDMSF